MQSTALPTQFQKIQKRRYLIIKEDIPYLELTNLLQLMVQTLNETTIYHMEILTQHEMAPNTFL